MKSLFAVLVVAVLIITLQVIAVHALPLSQQSCATASEQDYDLCRSQSGR
jgi:hypothetical protein